MLSFTDPRGGVTGYTYDAKNRLITRTDALTHAESFVYDDADNLVSHTDRKGQVTAYSYDELNRRTQTTWQGGATTSYTYDAGDRLTQVTDSVSGTITRTYDNRGIGSVLVSCPPSLRCSHHHRHGVSGPYRVRLYSCGSRNSVSTLTEFAADIRGWMSILVGLALMSVLSGRSIPISGSDGSDLASRNVQWQMPRSLAPSLVRA